MKYEKERQLAKQVMQERLGFAPNLTDIIPLESSHCYGQCTSVSFYVKGQELTLYQATNKGYLLITFGDKELEFGVC